MKKGLFLLLALSTSSIFGQDRIYVKSLVNGGYNQPIFSLSLLPLDFEGAIGTQSLSLNLRAFGFYEPVKNKLGLYYNVRHALVDNNANIFDMSKSNHLPKDIDASMYLIAKKVDRIIGTPIITKRNPLAGSYTYFVENYRQSIVKAMKIGYTNKSMDFYLGNLNKKPFFPFLPSKNYDLFMQSQGISIGYFRRSYSHIVVLDIANNKKHYSIGGSMFYADLIVMPFHKFSDRVSTENLTQDFVAEHKISPLGGRIGYKRYSSHAKFLRREAFSFEVGYLPYYGINFSFGIGFTLVNARIDDYAIN